MSFTDIDGYYIPAEVDAKFDEARAEIDEAKKLLFDGMNVIPVNRMLMTNKTELLSWKLRTVQYLERHKGE